MNGALTSHPVDSATLSRSLCCNHGLQTPFDRPFHRTFYRLVAISFSKIRIRRRGDPGLAESGIEALPKLAW
jgi:hypothetical protein